VWSPSVPASCRGIHAAPVDETGLADEHIKVRLNSSAPTPRRYLASGDFGLKIRQPAPVCKRWVCGRWHQGRRPMVVQESYGTETFVWPSRSKTTRQLSVPEVCETWWRHRPHGQTTTAPCPAIPSHAAGTPPLSVILKIAHRRELEAMLSGFTRTPPPTCRCITTPETAEGSPEPWTWHVQYGIILVRWSRDEI
jgi:hypothetical protein